MMMKMVNGMVMLDIATTEHCTNISLEKYTSTGRAKSTKHVL